MRRLFATVGVVFCLLIGPFGGTPASADMCVGGIGAQSCSCSQNGTGNSFTCSLSGGGVAQCSASSEYPAGGHVLMLC